MNNSQKTVYIIAIIAIVLLITTAVFSTRVLNGYQLKRNVMISLNTEDGHGVNIEQDVDFVSFETGLSYNLKVSSFPDPNNSTISVAIPIKHLEPNALYQCVFKFKMETNTTLPIQIKTNSGITNEQTSFETDVDFKPITINRSGNEYVVDLKFETNDEGIGYVIFDFNVDDTIDTLDVKLSNVIFTNFKEMENDNVDSEQTSETPVEVI